MLGKHNDAIAAMVWSSEYSKSLARASFVTHSDASDVLITVSWDETLKVWDP